MGGSLWQLHSANLQKGQSDSWPWCSQLQSFSPAKPRRNLTAKALFSSEHHANRKAQQHTRIIGEALFHLPLAFRYDVYVHRPFSEGRYWPQYPWPFAIDYPLYHCRRRSVQSFIQCNTYVHQSDYQKPVMFEVPGRRFNLTVELC